MRSSRGQARTLIAQRERGRGEVRGLEAYVELQGPVLGGGGRTGRLGRRMEMRTVTGDW